jgi:hypothetical protein
LLLRTCDARDASARNRRVPVEAVVDDQALGGWRLVVLVVGPEELSSSSGSRSASSVPSGV